MHSQKTCLLTGANGYIGRELANSLERKGWKVIEIGRTPSFAPSSSLSSDPSIEKKRDFIHWSLVEPLDVRLLPPADVLIHCAWDFSCPTLQDSLIKNTSGSIKLFEDAKQAGVKRLIFISTTSAFQGAKTIYGQSKLKVEEWVLAHQGVVVRPGLVIGEKLGGILKSLNILAVRLPIIPLPGGGTQKFYPCWIDDLCQSICFLSSVENLPVSLGCITAASEVPISLREILQEFNHRAGKSSLFLSIPWQPLFILLRVIEALGIRLRLRSDALLSLMNLDPSPSFTFTQVLGFRFKEFRK